jgi:hypothetical protein
MFGIPERAAAFDNREFCEVVFRWRRSGRPLKCPGIPWIIAGLFAPEVGVNEVVNEEEDIPYWFIKYYSDKVKLN